MKQKGIIFGLAAGILWGLDGIFVGKLDSGKSFLISTLLYACIHDGLAAMWLLIFNVCKGKGKDYIRCIHSKSFAVIIMCAAIGGTAGTAFNISAIRLTGAAAACAVTCTYPAAGALMGIIFLKEKCRANIAGGIILIVTGAFLISFSKSISVNAMGMLSAFGAMLCWASEGTLSKKATDNFDSDTATGLRELISFSLYFLILCFMAVFAKADIISCFSKSNIIFTAFASVCGAFSYLCWYRSMKISGVVTGMSLNATYVLWAMIFESISGEKAFSLRFLTSAVLILCGIAFTIYKRKEE